MSSCKVATTNCLQVPSVLVLRSGHARGMPRGPSVGAVLSLEVDPMFLACVANATWHDTDVEMHKFALHSRGPHALFHVKQLHGYDLVFWGSGESARLLVSAACR